jgi:hypothetical protein
MKQTAKPVVKVPAKPIKREVKTMDYKEFKRNSVVLSMSPQDLAKLIELARDQKHRLTTYDWDDLHDRLSCELTSHISVWG